MRDHPRIAITAGEPAGIGPDLCVKLAHRNHNYYTPIIIADPELLQQRAAILGVDMEIRLLDDATPSTQAKPGQLLVAQVMLAAPATAGILNQNNAPYVLSCLDRAVDLVDQQVADAIVTAPVQKSIINDAGIPFSGHTEYFAEKCRVPLTVMMLATSGLRVALATTHLPLRAVADAITQQSLTNVLEILQRDLQDKFGLRSPRILVCGLNPHAGEGGHLGHEEIEIITPVLEQQRTAGMNLIGPLPADTLFTDKVLQGADAVLAMYHDQGLPVLKYKGFGDACNITLGLPLIRTSVDHGTALDLAGTGNIDSGSLHNAISTAVSMAEHWQ